MALASRQQSQVPRPSAGADETIGGQEPTASDTSPGKEALSKRLRRNRWIIIALVTGYLIHVAWRMWLAYPLHTPIVHGDEDRYLLFARVLAGGPGGGGGDTEATRRAGYALLITPAYWFSSDPFTVYRIVQVFNALINALTFPLAYLFARRVLEMDRRWALGAGFVAASLPAVVFFAPFALPNAVLTPILLGWLLTLHGWITADTRKAQIWHAAGSAALLGLMYVVHVRALLLLPLHVLIALGLLFFRRTTWIAAAASGGVLAALMALHPLLKAALAGKMTTGGIEPDNRMLTAFTTVDGVLRTVSDATGQIWYLTIATWGLAGIGLIYTVHLLSKIRAVPPSPQAIILGTTLLATVVIAVVTSAALPDDGKANNHAFPGYIIFLAPVWAMIAFAALRQTTKRIVGVTAGAATLLMVACFIVESYSRPRPSTLFAPIDAPEPSFLSNDWSRLRYAFVTAVILGALILTLALSIAGRRFVFLAPAVIAAAIVVSVVAAQDANRMMAGIAGWEYATGPKLVSEAGVRPGEVVVSGAQFGVWANHQREIYWMAVRPFDPRVTPEPPADATIVIAELNTGWGVDWDGSKYGWQQIGVDRGRGWAVWRRPGS